METWEKWEPLTGLTSNYIFDCVLENFDGLHLTLREVNGKNKLQFSFETIESYRNTDETYRINTFSYLSKKYGTNFYANWSFFKVINSEYLNWLSKESDTISDYRDLKHFVICDSNCIFDVVSLVEPTVQFIK